MSPVVRRGVLCLLMSLTVICGWAGTAHSQETEGRKYAVLIGVRNYDRNQLRSLPYPENDVTELAELLRQSGFRRVELITQTEGAAKSRALPLAKTIRETLTGMLEDRTKDDLVLVAFAGHGVQFRGEKEHYFCPMDAVLADKSTLISLTDVYKQLELSKAGTKLLIVDACRNDPLAGNARDGGDAKLESVTRPQLPDPPGGVAALFSCSAGQKAFEDESLKHGVFFHHVIRGLKGEARLKRRDEVTWDSLVAHVKAEVPDTVKDLFGNTTRQIPEHKGELRGETTLVSFAKPNLPIAPPSVTPTTPSTTKPNVPGKIIISKSTGMKLALIPAGTFLMGSSAFEAERSTDEGPPHSVRISEPFHMGIHEVTQSEYGSVMQTNPSYFSKNGPGNSDVITEDTSKLPVDRVTWFDAVEFCNKLSEKDELIPYYSLTVEKRENRSIILAKVSATNGTGYRLPTEAEWEYACRAKTTTPFHFGSTLNGDKANVDGNHPYGFGQKGDFLEHPTAVGSYVQNAFGLFNMHGNVWEWCDDVYDEKAYSKRIDPMPDSGVVGRFGDQVIRGGSWDTTCGIARSAKREKMSPEDRRKDLGFRVVLPVDTSKLLSSPQSIDVAAPSSETPIVSAMGKLDTAISVAFDRTPLQDVIRAVAEKSGVTISIDDDALKLAGYTKNMAQMVTVTDKPARDVLAEIIKKNDRLVIAESGNDFVLTTKEAATKNRQKIVLP